MHSGHWHGEIEHDIYVGLLLRCMTAEQSCLMMKMLIGAADKVA